MSPTLVRLLTVGVVALSAASLALVVVIAT
jgi:hypothetical protein